MPPKPIHKSKVSKTADKNSEKKVTLGKIAAAFHSVGVDSKVAKGVLMGIAPTAALGIAYHYKGKNMLGTYKGRPGKVGENSQEIKAGNDDPNKSKTEQKSVPVPVSDDKESFT